MNQFYGFFLDFFPNITKKIREITILPNEKITTGSGINKPVIKITQIMAPTQLSIPICATCANWSIRKNIICNRGNK